MNSLILFIAHAVFLTNNLFIFSARKIYNLRKGDLRMFVPWRYCPSPFNFGKKLVHLRSQKLGLSYRTEAFKLVGIEDCRLLSPMVSNGADLKSLGRTAVKRTF